MGHRHIDVAIILISGVERCFVVGGLMQRARDLANYEPRGWFLSLRADIAHEQILPGSPHSTLPAPRKESFSLIPKPYTVRREQISIFLDD